MLNSDFGIFTMLTSRLGFGNILWLCLILSLVIPFAKDWHRKRSAFREALHQGEKAERGGTVG